jgi:hypothetical protein
MSCITIKFMEDFPCAVEGKNCREVIFKQNEKFDVKVLKNGCYADFLFVKVPKNSQIQIGDTATIFTAILGIKNKLEQN